MNKSWIIYMFIFSVLASNINTLSCLKQELEKEAREKENRKFMEQVKGITNKQIKGLKQIPGTKKSKFSNLRAEIGLLNLLQDSIKEKLEKTKKEKEEIEKSEECVLQKLINEKWEESEKLSKLDYQNSKEKIKKILEDYVAYQIIDTEKRYKACAILSEIEVDKKNYAKAKEHVDTILHSPKDIFLSPSTFAEAFSMNAKIFRHLFLMMEYKEEKDNKWLIKLNNKFRKKMETRLGKKIKNKELKKLYIKIVASNEERAIKFFKLCFAIANEPEEISYYEEKMLNSTINAGNYTVEYIYRNKNLSNEKREKYQNFAKKTFEDIIDYANKKEKELEQEFAMKKEKEPSPEKAIEKDKELKTEQKLKPEKKLAQEKEQEDTLPKTESQKPKLAPYIISHKALARFSLAKLYKKMLFNLEKEEEEGEEEEEDDDTESTKERNIIAVVK